MGNSKQTIRAVAPVIGGAATVVAGGALAPVAHAAPAVPEAGDAALSLFGGGPGTFESCDAYFGFGKEVRELVSFEVVDQNGADGIDHAVPDDTQVVLVLENEEGDLLECTPVEVTEEEWDDFAADEEVAAMPAYPGSGYYSYPSLEDEPFIDDEFGEAESVGFRVVGVPGGHTLVSPLAVEDLLQSGLDGEALRFLGQIDPRVVAHLEGAAGADAADAWDAADTTCSQGDPDLSGDDLAAAFAALETLVDKDGGDVTCDNMGLLNLDASLLLGLRASLLNVETITLSVPEGPTTTAQPTTTTTVQVQPSSTAGPTTTVVLARTGPAPSSSRPLALAGAASIAAGALALAARRRLRDGR